MDKHWDDFLRKLHTTSSIERTAGSRQPWLTRTAEIPLPQFEDTVEVKMSI